MSNDSFARVLLPADLTVFDRYAFRWAQRFHNRLGSQVTLLYANEMHYQRSLVERALRSHAAEFLPNIPVQTRVDEGLAARAILHAADEMDADLVIMGTHARRGLKRALLGSVTQRVLQRIERPLLTVSPRQEPDEAEPVRTIICSRPTNEVLAAASRLGDAFDARLIVLEGNEAVAAAKRAKASLIITGAGDHGDLIREATCAVLTVGLLKGAFTTEAQRHRERVPSS